MSEEKKSLFRSRENRIIAGVAGGFGEYFDIDATLVRVIFIFLVLFDGFGILLYAILAFIIPLKPTAFAASSADDSKNKTENIKKEMAETAQEIASKMKECKESFSQEFGKHHSQGWWASKRNVFALFLLILGFALLVENIAHIHLVRWGLFFPIVIIIFALYIIFSKN